jgi:mono/diheme cytochrome c family protein
MKENQVKIRSILAAIFLLTAVFASTACAQDTASLYKSKCAMCHGADGKGSAMGTKMGARDLTVPPASKETDDEWITITTKGKAKMPAYDGKLTGDQIKDLVKFLRTLK